MEPSEPCSSSLLKHAEDTVLGYAPPAPARKALGIHSCFSPGSLHSWQLSCCMMPPLRALCHLPWLRQLLAAHLEQAARGHLPTMPAQHTLVSSFGSNLMLSSSATQFAVLQHDCLPAAGVSLLLIGSIPLSRHVTGYASWWSAQLRSSAAC